MGKGNREKAHGLLTRPVAVFFTIALLATLIYSNTFSSTFHFDDNHTIVHNARIKDPGSFLDFSGTRYVSFLSFALNYHFGGLSVFGYHLVNLLIHITNGFLVYSLVLLWFRAAHLNSKLSTQNLELVSAPWIALATALLFVAHPIQTQAVTYIAQRFASLAALFYLLAAVCYLKWRVMPSGNRRRYLWYIGAWVSTVLAMKTKEISFTLPLMIVLIEAVFFWPLTRKHWMTLIPFLITLSIIPLSLPEALGEAETGLARETTEVSRSDYLFTQVRVIMTYLRLLVLPINQNLDYDYPIHHSFFEPSVLLSFLFLLSLFALSLFLLFNLKFRTPNSRLIAFGLLWFFLTLSIESSIIPIRDVIFEHRLYLPSAGFILAASIAASRLISGSLSRILSLSLILLIFSAATYQRNLVWKNEASLWEDVVSKAPGKARTHNNLGVAYDAQQRFEEAIQEYQTAIKLKPDYAEAHNNLGVVYENLRRLEDAAQEYQIALKLQPNYADAHNNLGIIYAMQGRLEEAAQEYQTALKVEHNHAVAHYNLGITYKDLGRWEDAVREYQAALKLKPDWVEAHDKLGRLFDEQGRLEEAVREYRTALKIGPDSAEIHNNLGNAYAAQKRLEDAVREYQAAVKLKPDFTEAHNNLGTVYADLGHLDDAIQEFQIALKLQPTHEGVHYNLGNAYLLKGRVRDARQAFERALEIKPDFPDARKALDSLSNKPPRLRRE
ncbi:MAG: tetratricopeptide repeat protein [Nitrospirae bacterium]|nr:tetratricopeptide repeat protein [Nitrospirota bacterium]